MCSVNLIDMKKSEICFFADINECYSVPCLHGGSCTDGNNSYTCSCTDGYTGINCEIGQYFISVYYFSTTLWSIFYICFFVSLQLCGEYFTPIICFSTTLWWIFYICLLFLYNSVVNILHQLFVSVWRCEVYFNQLFFSIWLCGENFTSIICFYMTLWWIFYICYLFLYDSVVQCRQASFR